MSRLRFDHSIFFFGFSRSFFADSFSAGLFFLALAASIFWTADARATDLQWGANGAGGSGTWNTTSTNWYDGTANTNWNNAAPDSAIFGGSAGGTITLGSAITVGNITVNRTDYSIATNNKLTLSNTTITVASGANLFISNAMAGTTGLIKDGAGTLTLRGGSLGNTYTGATRINGGVLNLTFGVAIGNTEAVILANASGAELLVNWNETIGSLQGGGSSGGNVSLASTRHLDVDERGVNTFAGVISGQGALQKSGTGTMILTGANTFSGGMTNWAGTVRVGNDQALGTGAFRMDTAGLASDGASARTITNAITFGGSQKTFGDAVGTGDLLFAGSVNNLANQVMFVSNKTTFSGTISGAGGISKDGTGTLILSGSNTYAGATKLSGGTLRVGNDSALSTNTFTITGGTFASDGATARTIANNTIINGSTITLGDATGTGALTFNNINLGASVRTIQVSNSTTVSGVISDSGGISKRGAGTLTLSGANTYTGETRAAGGTLIVASGGSIAASSGSIVQGLISAGAHLKVNGVAGAVTVNNYGTLSGSGSVGAVTLNSGGTLAVGNSPGTMTATSATWNPGSTFQFEIIDATGVAGTAWDLFSITGNLNLTTISASSVSTKMNLFVLSTELQNFDINTEYSWVFAKAASLSGSAGWTSGLDVTDRFVINSTGFNDGNQPSLGFKVVTGTDGDGMQTLSLRSAVPEPSSASLLILGLAAVLARSRRCRR